MDDRHGPKYGCTYQKCGNPSQKRGNPFAGPCPFVKDHRPTSTGTKSVTYPNSVTYGCSEHEWRQLVDPRYHGAPEFYCIHCRKVEQN